MNEKFYTGQKESDSTQKYCINSNINKTVGQYKIDLTKKMSSQKWSTLKA